MVYVIEKWSQLLRRRTLHSLPGELAIGCISEHGPTWQVIFVQQNILDELHGEINRFEDPILQLLHDHTTTDNTLGPLGFAWFFKWCSGLDGPRKLPCAPDGPSILFSLWVALDADQLFRFVPILLRQALVGLTHFHESSEATSPNSDYSFFVYQKATRVCSGTRNTEIRSSRLHLLRESIKDPGERNREGQKSQLDLSVLSRRVVQQTSVSQKNGWRFLVYQVV